MLKYLTASSDVGQLRQAQLCSLSRGTTRAWMTIARPRLTLLKQRRWACSASLEQAVITSCFIRCLGRSTRPVQRGPFAQLQRVVSTARRQN